MPLAPDRLAPDRPRSAHDPRLYVRHLAVRCPPARQMSKPAADGARGSRPRRPALRGWRDRHQDVVGEREDHEQHGQRDGELEEPLFDAPPAAVDRRVAAEGRTQAGAACLQQDRGHQRDADRDLTDRENPVH